MPWLLHRCHGFDSRARHLWQATFGARAALVALLSPVCWTCLSSTLSLTRFNRKTLFQTLQSGCKSFSQSWHSTLSGPGPVNCRMRDNGCGLHNDGKFWDCRTSGQFPNWNFVRLSSLVVKCPGCCTGVMGSIPGPDTCDRQHLGQELHWWHYSHKCVGLVCPPQLP